MAEPNHRATLPSDGLAACLVIHDDQYRKDKKTPYAIHPIRVALNLASFGLGSEYLCAALLHDALEDQPHRITREVIQRDFGSNVADVVVQLTKDGSKSRRQYISSFSTASPAACLIKLFDRLDNLRDWAGMDPDFKPAYAEEAERLLQAVEANEETMSHTGGNYNDRLFAAAFKFVVTELREEIKAARAWKVEATP